MLDVLISLILLAILLLPMAILLIVDAVDLGCSPIFVQERIGRGGKPFSIYKIRTMRMEAPRDLATGALDDPHRYITPFGSFLRKFSLDELPQLWNTLRGDMSLIGPRPLIPQETAIHRMRRAAGVYALRPGMTGLAQINGRDMVSAAEKVRFDAQYLRDFGLRQDAAILFRSIAKVLRSEGVREGSGKPKLP